MRKLAQALPIIGLAPLLLASLACSDPRTTAAMTARRERIDWALDKLAHKQEYLPGTPPQRAQAWIEAREQAHAEMLENDGRRIRNSLDEQTRNWHDRAPVRERFVTRKLAGDPPNADAAMHKMFD